MICAGIECGGFNQCVLLKSYFSGKRVDCIMQTKIAYFDDNPIGTWLDFATVADPCLVRSTCKFIKICFNCLRYLTPLFTFVHFVYCEEIAFGNVYECIC